MIHTRVLLVTQRSYRSQTQQHTDSTKRSVPGWERTYNALVSTLCVSTLPTMPARHKIRIIRHNKTHKTIIKLTLKVNDKYVKNHANRWNIIHVYQ